MRLREEELFKRSKLLDEKSASLKIMEHELLKKESELLQKESDLNMKSLTDSKENVNMDITMFSSPVPKSKAPDQDSPITITSTLLSKLAVSTPVRKETMRGLRNRVFHVKQL